MLITVERGYVTVVQLGALSLLKRRRDHAVVSGTFEILWYSGEQLSRHMQAMPPPLHTQALGTDARHSHCGSETRRSTTLLLGLILLLRQAHAVALDDGRRFRSLVLPAHQEPSEDDRGHRHSQQADTRTVTDPIGWPELGLIDLWSLARRTVSY